ncbi:TetR/AcrR family transcriptional regulator [Streptomyces sp. VNUA24]|uniref:TetR/AcrR family transcriptional regulator n=1 Tax=Streptomyces sp. VNUA24 TaxID=3031131 RepID=UPI0023B7F2B9|nr:TetR/AcrR family transcriptional regulator [Streptomyces sp. VNUA24]WEH20067.1 helix-turn-helix domain containing protein [Streptomyces sp. VNUA24]
MDPADSRSGVTRDRSTPLKVDAQRNLEHVLRAAREVFGELGYGAPIEDVARRARVGVGTVYRRFPSKDILVRRIAEEEVSRLIEQARAALGQEDEPWSALARFVRTSASGGGRLVPAVPLHRDQTDQPMEQQDQLPAAGMASLMEVVGQLVHRAHVSGELRPDVTVEDVLLLISSSPSPVDDPALEVARQARLLDICLEGLRCRSE